MPYFEKPFIYDISLRPFAAVSDATTRDGVSMQIGAQLLYRPKVEELPMLWLKFEPREYEEKVTAVLAKDIPARKVVTFLLSTSALFPIICRSLSCLVVTTVMIQWQSQSSDCVPGENGEVTHSHRSDKSSIWLISMSYLDDD
jgi:hypothetical protein